MTIAPNSTAHHSKSRFSSVGGWRGFFTNPGLVLHTLRHGRCVGVDASGNSYFEAHKTGRSDGRKRRWVVYAGGARDASLVPPEWHAWLHYTTDVPLPESGRRPWQARYVPNATGTADAYRPPGHDYRRGLERQMSPYEAWTPDE